MQKAKFLFAMMFPALFVLVSMRAEPEEKAAVRHGVRTFVADKAHSEIGFRVRHLGIANVNGVFDDYEAKVIFDPGDLSTLKAEARVEVASIDTGIERRDDHLRSGDFFYAEAFPAMRFMSTSVRSIDRHTFELVGNLTIRDVTKEVVFKAELLQIRPTEVSPTIIFQAEAVVNRFDYNLNWDEVTEIGRLAVAENVRIRLYLEMNEQAEHCVI